MKTFVSEKALILHTMEVLGMVDFLDPLFSIWRTKRGLGLVRIAARVS